MINSFVLLSGGDYNYDWGGKWEGHMGGGGKVGGHMEGLEGMALDDLFT